MFTVDIFIDLDVYYKNKDFIETLIESLDEYGEFITYVEQHSNQYIVYCDEFYGSFVGLCNALDNEKINYKAVAGNEGYLDNKVYRSFKDGIKKEKVVSAFQEFFGNQKGYKIDKANEDVFLSLLEDNNFFEDPDEIATITPKDVDEFKVKIIATEFDLLIYTIDNNNNTLIEGSFMQADAYIEDLSNYGNHKDVIFNFWDEIQYNIYSIIDKTKRRIGI